jgi:large subunit ribosomal protein L5
MTPNFQDKYNQNVRPILMEKYKYSSTMAIPKIQKIVLNMGLGEATKNSKLIDGAVVQMAAITGLKPVIRKARKAIATFKLRENMPIGVSVTLRRDHMWEFLERLISVALPRVRDFRGVSSKAFDGRGNYTLGIKEQIIFPEINFDEIEKIKGLNITVVTTAKTDEESRDLLRELGMPFRK